MQILLKEKLPYSIRILLECALRNCDGFNFKQEDVENILNWKVTSQSQIEVPFKPSRVLLQDFTGVPAVVDLAAMRETVKRLGGNPENVNPLCPVDLVIDHSVQVDFYGDENALHKNEELEFERNKERFQFLKWGQNAFSNFLIVPPGSGIVHQVNLEYLGRVVFSDSDILYPDSLVGTDSHTPMINGLGVIGWGVGGIEAEAVMMGEVITMLLPEVVGFKLTGQLSDVATATDLVLTITQMLRQRKVVGKFVEFYGEGVQSLNVTDRATISNMCPEYGATVGYFPIDEKTIEYLRTTGRSPDKIEFIETYLKAQKLFKVYDGSQEDPDFSGQVLELDLSNVQPCLAGPKRPQDKVLLSQLKTEFQQCLTSPQGFKGFNVSQEKISNSVSFLFQGQQYELTHGSVIISAITSCTNTSNPDVLMAAGLLAKNAVEKGLSVKPYIKTSLSPGSQVVTTYFEKSGLTTYLNKLGYYLAGYGCMTCIGNSGSVDKSIEEAVNSKDLVVAAVLSGNRNFEGRVHPLTQANYLASPPLCVAYALAGTVAFDFETQELGKDQNGNSVFLKDIWPTKSEIKQYVNKFITAEMFSSNYSKISQGTDKWNTLPSTSEKLYPWQESSTYIHNPPFFQQMTLDLPLIQNIQGAKVLGLFGDFITTDHISPAGNIAKNSAAGKFLEQLGVAQKDFNSYGSRRGNDLIMARGTFANVRIINKLLDGKVGPQTLHIPSMQIMTFYEASIEYQKENISTIIIAGAEYGSGSSRDWAAKGPYLQGIKGVIAISFERIHKSNLIGMGILPMEFLPGQNSQTLNLNGKESYNINLNNGNLKPNQLLKVSTDNGIEFDVKIRLDTDVEVNYFKNGGILQYVLRKLSKK